MSEQQLPEEDIYVDIVDEQEEEFAFSVEELLTKAIQAAAKHEGIADAEVSVSLVDDARIQELNRDYRGKDQPTDVLSFALEEDAEDDDAPEILFDEEDEVEDVTMLGDIIISIPTAKRQAEEYGHSLEREVAFLAVHGFLHLIGYDHMTEADEKEMFSRQDTILDGAGFTRG